MVQTIDSGHLGKRYGTDLFFSAFLPTEVSIVRFLKQDFYLIFLVRYIQFNLRLKFLSFCRFQNLIVRMEITMLGT